jgi:D-glycero-beta-D-manno-heptose-7-phosphate kinase
MTGLRAALAQARVLVVGDVMLDRYWFGEVQRISPEAPVPVVRIERTEERLGGAANVARNVAALGAQVTLLSVVGADEAGEALARILTREGIEASLHIDPEVNTTVKLRVIGRKQQIVRIDFESQPGHEILGAKLEDFRRRLRDHETVILSDYGKGGLRHIEEMIAEARGQSKTVLVDPKGDDWSRYHHADLITPNRAEFREVAGSWQNEEEMARKAQALRRDLNLKALLLTRSEEGMTLYHDGGIHHEAARAREVFDVTGAGDTVVATLGAMLAAGLDLTQAVGWANRAAGIVVGKLGTAVAYQDELFGPADAL